METSPCTMAQATYDDDSIDELHAQLGPFGCGRTCCCSRITAEKPLGAVLEVPRAIVFYITFTFLISEMIQAGVPFEQLLSFFDNLSLLSALMLTSAFTVASYSTAIATPPSVLAWTMALSLLQLFLTVVFKFLLLITINAELSHGSVHKERLQAMLQQPLPTDAAAALHHWKEAAAALHNFGEEKTGRTITALRKEMQSLPIYGFVVLCALAQACLLVVWIFYWIRANSEEEFRVLVCIGMGMITIGLPLIIARFYRNHALVKLRAGAGGAQKTF